MTLKESVQVTIDDVVNLLKPGEILVKRIVWKWYRLDGVPIFHEGQAPEGSQP